MVEQNLSQSLAAAAKQGAAVPKYVQGQLIKVPVAKLVQSRYQPRTAHVEEKVLELVALIRAQGLLQPIGVRPHTDGTIEIVFGHQRTEAFRRLAAEPGGEKWLEIPAIVQLALDDENMALAAYAENQRANLTLLEEANHLSRMLGEGHASSPKELAEKLGQPLNRVERLLRLAKSAAVVKDALGGLMVVVGKDGEGKEQKERRSLDLMAALAFQRLWTHLQGSSSVKKADERTERSIRRALAGNWNKARIEKFVDDIVKGKARPDTLDGDGAPEEQGVVALFTKTPKRLVFEVPKSAPTPAQLEAARAAFEEYLRSLGTGA